MAVHTGKRGTWDDGKGLRSPLPRTQWRVSMSTEGPIECLAISSETPTTTLHEGNNNGSEEDSQRESKDGLKDGRDGADRVDP